MAAVTRPSGSDPEERSPAGATVAGLAADEVGALAEPPGGGGRTGTRLVVLLGEFELVVDGGALAVPCNVERLVAFLAVCGTSQPRAQVAGTLWPEMSDPRAAARLRAVLWRAEQVAPGWVLRDRGRLTLAPDVRVDLHEAVRHAHHVTDADEEALPPGEEAFEDLRRDLLPHWGDDWLLYERERLRQLRVHALEALCRRLAARGRMSQAIDAGIAAVASEPLRESAHRALITAHLVEGNASEARRQFFTYRDLLEEHLGIAPTPTLRELALGSRGSSR